MRSATMALMAASQVEANRVVAFPNFCAALAGELKVLPVLLCCHLVELLHNF